MCVFCWVTFHSFCGLTKYTAVGTALDPTLTIYVLVIGPGVSQALFSPGHQCRSIEVRTQGCSICAPGPTVGTMEASETLALSNFVCMSPQSPQLLKPVLFKLQEH